MTRTAKSKGKRRQQPLTEPGGRGPGPVILVIVVFFAALCLRMIHLHDARNSPLFYYPLVDEASYDAKAQRIAGGDILGDKIFYQDPVYPYFLGFLYWITGRDLFIVKLIQFVLGALNAALIFWIAKEVFGARAALVSGLFAAFYPVFIFYEGLLVKSSLSLLLSDLAILAFLIGLERKRGRTFFLAGIALGGACLTRGNFLFIVPFALAWAMVACMKGGGPLARRVACPALLAAGVLVMIAPVTARNYWVGKDFVLITAQAGQNFYIGNNEHNPTGRYVATGFFRPHPDHEEADFRREAERRTGRSLSPSQCSRYWFGEGLRFIQEHPLRFFETSMRKLWLAWTYFELPDNHDFYFDRQYSRLLRLPLPAFGLAAPLGLFGIIFSLKSNPKARVLFGFAALYTLTLLLFYVFARYRLPLASPLIVFSGFGALKIAGTFTRKRWSSVLGPPALLAALVIAANFPRKQADLSQSYSNLAAAYMEAQRYDQAVSALQSALERNPENGIVHFNLARCFQARGQFDKAARAYEQTHRLLPQLAEAWNNHGALEEKRGNPAKAETLYLQAVNTNPSLKEGYLNLAKLYERQAKSEEAARIYILYLDRFNDNSPETVEVRRKLTGR